MITVIYVAEVYIIIVIRAVIIFVVDKILVGQIYDTVKGSTILSRTNIDR